MSRNFDRSRDRKNATGVSSAVKTAFLRAVIREESAAAAAAWREALRRSVGFGAAGMFGSGCVFLILALVESKLKKRIARQTPAVSASTWFGLLDKLIQRAYQLDRELAALRYVQVDNRRLRFELQKNINSFVKRVEPNFIETAIPTMSENLAMAEAVSEDSKNIANATNGFPHSEIRPEFQAGIEVADPFTTRGFEALTVVEEGRAEEPSFKRTSELSKNYIQTFFEEKEPGHEIDLPPAVKELILQSSHTLRIHSNNIPMVRTILDAMCVREELIAVDESKKNVYWSIAGKRTKEITKDDAKSYIEFFKDSWAEQKQSEDVSIEIVSA